MLGELLKILADEPEKISKIFIRLFKIILSILLTDFLYRYLFHSTPFFDIRLSNNWISFFEQGKLFVYLFLYFVCEIFLFHVFSPISSFIPELLSKIKFAKVEKQELNLILKITGVIKYDETIKKIMPGKNFSLFHSIVDIFSNQESKEQIIDLKGSFIENIWQLYTASLFIFFLTGAYIYWPNEIYVYFFIGLGLLILFYYIIHNAIEYFIKNEPQLSFSAAKLRAQKIVYDALAKHFIIPLAAEPDNDLKRGVTFYIHGREYVLNFIYSTNEPHVNGFRKYVNTNENDKRYFLFVTNLYPAGELTALDC
ncbi:hypothetical protein IQ13_1379 [Lacibacter cauensis]|uniref:Uncharacterized protein n=1 Tax=Lacibacter cauensis TaxID=510947 RepID=A0A562SPR7_9BACT|nr:hypothetical protein IQ13_1379 [Lacibacter cauensis]